MFFEVACYADGYYIRGKVFENYDDALAVALGWQSSNPDYEIVISLVLW